MDVPAVLNGSWKRWAWVPLSIGCAVILFTGVAMLRGKTPRLNLSLQAEGDRLALQWDEGQSAVQAAVRGSLVINDGQDRREIELTPDDMMSGRITYRPHNDDVTLSLELRERDGRVVTKSLRTIDSRLTTAPQAVQAEPEAAGFVPPPESTTVTVLSSPPPAPKARPVPPVQKRPAFRPPSLMPRRERQTVQIAAAAPLPPSNYDGALQAIEWQQPTEPPPYVETRVPDDPMVFQPPTSRIKPEPKPEMSRLPSYVINSLPPSATVVASIDEQGRITDLRLAPGQKLDPMVGAEVLRVAALWQFKPARLHGQPVASEHGIVFRFRAR